MVKYLKLIIKIIVSSLFLGYLVFKINWPVIVDTLAKVELKFYLGSTVITLITIILMAYKYYLLINGTSISHSLISIIKINFITRFYALFIPAGVGVEAVRWYKITHNEKGRAFFLASTIFERSIFVFLLLLSGIVPLFLYPLNSEIINLRTRLLPAIVVSLVLVVVAIAYFIIPVFQKFLKSFFVRILPLHGKWQKIILFFENCTLRKVPLKSFGCLLILSILWQLFYIARVFFLSQALVLPFSFIDIVWMGSLVLLLQVIPISFAGIGLREGAFAYLFSLFKLPPEQGVAIGILLFSQMLLVSLIGGLLEWRGK